MSDQGLYLLPTNTSDFYLRIAINVDIAFFSIKKVEKKSITERKI